MIEKTLLFLVMFVPIILILTELVAKRFFGSQGFATQIISWVFSIGLLLLTEVEAFKIGIIPDWILLLTIIQKLIIGIAVGLVANGIFDIPFIQRILELLKIKQKPA